MENCHDGDFSDVLNSEKGLLQHISTHITSESDAVQSETPGDITVKQELNVNEYEVETTKLYSKVKAKIYWPYRDDQVIYAPEKSIKLEQSDDNYDTQTSSSVAAVKDEKTSSKRDRVKGLSGASRPLGECPVCGKHYQSLKIHMLAHSNERKHTCAKCSNAYKHKKHLLRHVRVAHDDSHAVRVTCDVCQRSFNEKSSLNRHKKLLHSGKSGGGGGIKREPKECNVLCVDCNRWFYSESGLVNHKCKAHTKRETTGKCSVCKKEFPTAYELARHKRKHRDRHLRVCRLCGKLIARDGMPRHLATHTDERPFKCPQCDKAYIRKSSLTEHITQKHSVGKKRHECQVCGAGFMRRYKRDSHMLAKHSDDDTVKNSFQLHKPITLKFTCSFCSERFACAPQLRRHEFAHTHQRPFPCQLCDSGYMSSRSLKRHVQSKHAS